jgi:hypothetical protein
VNEPTEPEQSQSRQQAGPATSRSRRPLVRPPTPRAGLTGPATIVPPSSTTPSPRSSS